MNTTMMVMMGQRIESGDAIELQPSVRIRSLPRSVPYIISSSSEGTVWIDWNWNVVSLYLVGDVQVERKEKGYSGWWVNKIRVGVGLCNNGGDLVNYDFCRVLQRLCEKLSYCCWWWQWQCSDYDIDPSQEGALGLGGVC